MFEVITFVVVVSVLVDVACLMLGTLLFSDNATNQDSSLANGRICFLVFVTWLRNLYADNQSYLGLYRLSSFYKYTEYDQVTYKSLKQLSVT